MLNNSTEFHPFKWLGMAAIACLVTFLLGLGLAPSAADPVPCPNSTVTTAPVRP